MAISSPSLIHPSGEASGPRPTVQVPLSKETSLGFDCGLGTTLAVVNGTGFPVAPSENGAFENVTSCKWIGDVALSGGGTADGTTEPLVADQDETFSAVSPKIGGGFTADVVYLQNGTSRMNGFDITVSWNPSILRAVRFDNAGTNWGALAPFTVAQTIDNTGGHAHLVQLVFQHFGLNFTLFRIRFDIVGIGTSGLTISNDVITNPGAVMHQTVQASFDSESFFDPAHTVNWSAIVTNSTPLRVGGPNTFTATISGGTPPYTYAWMFNGTNTTPFVSQNSSITSATTASVTRIMPVDNTVGGNRITLRVTDSASPIHIINVTQLLPFTMGQIQGPRTVPVNTLAGWSAIWLGGVPTYSGSWRLCPGKTGLTSVCTSPTPSFAQVSQNNTQILSGASPGYHFSGVYNVSAQVTTSGAGPVLASTVGSSFLLNVTGGIPAFIIQVNGDQNATVGFAATISASVGYSTSYPSNVPGTAFRSGQFIYTFNFGDGTPPVIITSGLSVSATHTFTSAANYPVTIVAQDTLTPSQIRETGFGTLNVATVVTGDFSFTPASSIVTGQEITFTPNFSGGVAPYSYSWSFGDSTTDNAASPTHKYGAIGTYTVTVTITDSNGRKFVTMHMVSISQAATPPPPPADNSILIYGGVGAAVIVVATSLLLLRRRRARRGPAT